MIYGTPFSFTAGLSIVVPAVRTGLAEASGGGSVDMRRRTPDLNPCIPTRDITAGR